MQRDPGPDMALFSERVSDQCGFIAPDWKAGLVPSFAAVTQRKPHIHTALRCMRTGWEIRVTETMRHRIVLSHFDSDQN